MSLWEHPGRGYRWTFPPLEPEPKSKPKPKPKPEVKKIMSIPLWCDTHQGCFPSTDVDHVTMSMEVPKIENNVRVGVAYTVERHKCGPCLHDEQALMEKRRAISAGALAAEEHLRGAVSEAWADERAEVPRTFTPPGERADHVPPRHEGYSR